MVDLSKHVERARQSLAKRQYELAMQICTDSLDLGPAVMELHRLMLDAAKRNLKENGKPGLMKTMSMRLPVVTKDPHKALLAQIKSMSILPEPKVIAGVAGAAAAYWRSGNKPMGDVAGFYYDEVIASGLFLADSLEAAAIFFYDWFMETRDLTQIEKAISLLTSLEKNLPTRADIPPKLKNWTATYATNSRDKGGGAGGDFRSQVNNMDAAKRAEVLNRLVRTVEDARDVLAILELDAQGEGGQDKAIWLKKGDLERRFISIEAARKSFERAKALDQHDFTIDRRLDELKIDELKARADAAGGDPAPKAELLKFEIESLRRWADKQPTDLSHRYNLGVRLIRAGDIDGAAGEFQRAVVDAKLKRGAHRYLGYCFAKKNLLDLASQQYTAYLSLVDDDQTDEAKEVRYARARLFEDLARRDDAIKDYDRIASIDLNYKDVAPRLSKLRGV